MAKVELPITWDDSLECKTSWAIVLAADVPVCASDNLGKGGHHRMSEPHFTQPRGSIRRVLTFFCKGFLGLQHVVKKRLCTFKNLHTF